MSVQNDPAASLGSGVAGRVARHIADAMVATRVKMGPHQSAVAQDVLRQFTNHVSDEIRGALGPLWVQIADNPDTPDELRPLFSALGREQGQAWAMIGGFATSAALGGGLLDLLNNYLNPVIHPLIRLSPNGILSPDQNAAIGARRLETSWSPKRDSASGGIDADVYESLVKLHRALPTITDIWQLMNRGELSKEDARKMLRHYGHYDEHIDRILGLKETELTAAEVAAMWNRGIFDTPEAHRLARRVGTSVEQMDRMLELGGEPPAPQELLLAWRRGIITEAQVDRALRQSPLRFEWIPIIKSLQWQPLPLAEAADAVNQGHLTREAAGEVARDHGVRDEDFQVIVDNAGIPPGPQTVLDWANRGLITEAEGLQMLYESRIKNRWVPTYFKSRHEVMPPETVRLMYSRGALTRDDAIRRLQARGYSPEDAAIVINGAVAEKTEKERDLTVAQIRDLFTDRLISEQDALSMLDGAGYAPEEAQFILDLGLLARMRRYINAVITRIRTGYVTGNLTEQDAQTRLDQLGIPADSKDEMLSLWGLERDSVTRTLTTAQITAAVKKGFMSSEDAFRRLVGSGYSDADATIILQLAGAIQ
jgi:hypothetical protein